MVAEQFTLGTRAHTFGNDFMTKILRKGRVERTGYTVLNTSENPFMAASYRVVAGSGGGGGTGGVFTGSASPEGSVTAPVGSVYNQIVAGVFTAQWVKVSGSGNTGWQ